MRAKPSVRNRLGPKATAVVRAPKTVAVVTRCTPPTTLSQPSVVALQARIGALGGDDRIVHEQAEHEDEAEHGQHVDRHGQPENLQRGQAAEHGEGQADDHPEGQGEVEEQGQGDHHQQAALGGVAQHQVDAPAQDATRVVPGLDVHPSGSSACLRAT
jgi:hypothetical protein